MFLNTGKYEMQGKVFFRGFSLILNEMRSDVMLPESCLVKFKPMYFF